jgi:hypothetical protein
LHLLLTFSNGGRSSLSYDFNKNKLSLLPVFLGLCLSSPFDYNNNIKNFKTMFTLRSNDSNHVVYLKPSKLCGSSHSPMLTIHKESCKYKWHWHPWPWALGLGAKTTASVSWISFLSFDFSVGFIIRGIDHMIFRFFTEVKV